MRFHSNSIPTKFLPFLPNSYHSDQIPLGSAWNAWLGVKYSGNGRLSTKARTSRLGFLQLLGG